MYAARVCKTVINLTQERLQVFKMGPVSDPYCYLLLVNKDGACFVFFLLLQSVQKYPFLLYNPFILFLRVLIPFHNRYNIEYFPHIICLFAGNHARKKVILHL